MGDHDLLGNYLDGTVNIIKYTPVVPCYPYSISKKFRGLQSGSSSKIKINKTKVENVFHYLLFMLSRKKKIWR